MLDYPALRALAAIVQAGSFEKAARQLGVTPSAVSQRIKQLEERLGAALVTRAAPCTATPTGEWLCRHVERVGLMESELFAHLPELLPPGAPPPRVTLHLAANADSLATWFLPALARLAEDDAHLVHLSLDDEDHTANWLRRGQVVAAVTSVATPIQGCHRLTLGALRYHATASPAYVARFFPDGVTAEALARAPALTFNQKDRLQERWIVQTLGRDVAGPTHWLPSSQGFVAASLAGMGWGMNPEALVREALADGRLVELIPGRPLDIPLYWQVNRLAAERLTGLTRQVMTAARSGLRPPPD